jgi:hypothetical protein
MSKYTLYNNAFTYGVIVNVRFNNAINDSLTCLCDLE